MQPTRTQTGYRIEPSRLVECLQFLYHWLLKEQWWHLYGDGLMQILHFDWLRY